MDPRGETTAMEQEYKITVRPATLGDASFMAHTFVESLKGSPWWNYVSRWTGI